MPASYTPKSQDTSSAELDAYVSELEPAVHLAERDISESEMLVKLKNA